MSADFVADVLGGSWEAETIDLGSDDEGRVVATLVHRWADGEGPGERAVLHVHGFADYFFQADYGQWWLDRGYDVYALDLRKYGRSIRPWQTPTYVADLGEYDADLDAAWHRVAQRDGHDHVVVSAHSTGGLTLPLWLERRRPAELAGVVLNSPWLDLQGAPWLRSVGTLLIDQIGARWPQRVLGREVKGLYGRSLHREHDGEWDFDLDWKPLLSFPVMFGWLRAIRRGHAVLHRGLSLSVPILVLSSDRSTTPAEMGEDVHASDMVLDVSQIRRWSPCLGTHVTYVAVPGARHDVVLSRAEPRARAYDELGRWVGAYLSA
ncbi:alpha/beta hydrolase [Nocardioides acrostichi]|uniref:Alpha/beta hydrolase n=1 Tax=Nocardioides acrostichi TaxID=2784339 RepID=A0A930UYD1_9ACTN|nr:alpha/beta hydrolase [Nocardioides acrostichi]MBF4163138.1 alpha/beta hydrolase [Nocardioides acrostichi]